MEQAKRGSIAGSTTIRPTVLTCLLHSLRLLFSHTQISLFYTPLSYSMSLLDAAACGDLNLVTSLVASFDATTVTKAATDWLLAVDSHGYSAAAFACCHDDLDVLCVLLSTSQSFLSVCTHNGSTLLHLASQEKSLRCLEYLLALAEDTPAMINATNNYNETPLHLAACAGNGDSVRRLLQAGAECLIQDKYGRSPSTVSKHDSRIMLSENPDHHITQMI